MKLSDGVAVTYRRKDDMNNLQLVVCDKLTVWGSFALVSELPFLKMEASESSM